MDSEDKTGLSRRRFIVGVSTGVVGATCSSKTGRKQTKDSDDAAPAVALSPREAIVAVALMIGPWKLKDRGVADEFLRRFLTPNRLDYLKKHKDAFAQLPQTLSKVATVESTSGKIDKIPLKELSTPESEAVLELLRSIYAIREVRFYTAGESAPGTCMVDLSFIAEVPT